MMSNASFVPSAASSAALPGGVSLRHRFAALSTESAIAVLLRQERETLLAETVRPGFAERDAGGDWMHRHAELLDTCLRRLLSLAGERGVQSAKTGIAVLATGGYGQRTLAPHSDIDLSFLSARDDDSASGRVLRAFFNMVMDTLASGAKYKVGYGYRTLPDVESLPAQGVLPYDHQTQTALLDARLVAGDSVLFARFDRSFLSHLQIADFLFRKHAEWMRRRDKFGTSPLLSEPNLKEGAGGLRDLQTAAWMARVRFGKHPASIGSGELWRDVARRKFITEGEKNALLQDRDFLLSVRCSLHANAGERKDFFGRARQEAVALAGGEDLETFLHRYYACAERIARVSEKIITRCLESPIPLPTPGLAVARRQVVVSEPDRLDAEAAWSVRAVAYCQKYNLHLATATEEAIARAAETRGGEPGGAAGLRELLEQGGDVAASVRRLHKTGLLAVLLPELASCMTLPAHDPAHRYTVGEHTLRVLENIASLAQGDTATVGYQAPAPPPATPEAAALRELLQSLDSPMPLFVAALLHDIGKRTRTLQDGTPAPHERTGAEESPDICRRLGLSDADSDTVTALVRQHLLMAQVARLRDLNLPETVRQFADSVGTHERLKMLYLLTWADTSAVAPGVWTPLQAAQVGELFGRAFEYLEGRDNGEAPETGVAGFQEGRERAVRDRLRRQLAREAELSLPREERDTGQAERGEAARAHSETMPSAYLLATPLPVMAKHVHMVTRLLETGGRPVVDLRTASVFAAAGDADTTELIVVALDDPAPGLLAKITGVLLAFDVRVYSVQAFTRTQSDNRRIALDTLSISYHDKPLPPLKRADVADALTLVLSGELPLSDLLKKRGRENAAIAPLRTGVRVLMTDATVGQNLTLLDLAAPNEIGIVYRLCACLTALGVDIRSARISLFGGNARCAFYVSDPHGGAVAAEPLQRGIEAAFPVAD